jgi:hypothetical protein
VEIFLQKPKANERSEVQTLPTQRAYFCLLLGNRKHKPPFFIAESNATSPLKVGKKKERKQNHF